MLPRVREPPHAVEVNIDDLSDEVSAANMTFLNRWADAYNALASARKDEPKRRGPIVSSLLTTKKSVK